MHALSGVETRVQSRQWSYQLKWQQLSSPILLLCSVCFNLTSLHLYLDWRKVTSYFCLPSVPRSTPLSKPYFRFFISIMPIAGFYSFCHPSFFTNLLLSLPLCPSTDLLVQNPCRQLTSFSERRYKLYGCCLCSKNVRFTSIKRSKWWRNTIMPRKKKFGTLVFLFV